MGYFGRFRRHPLSCLGHILQGALCGGLILSGWWELAVVGALWVLLYIAYQGLSMARKAINKGAADTGGLDTSDAIVGLGLALAAYAILQLTEVLL